MARRPWALALLVALCGQVLVFGASPLRAAPGQRDASFGPADPLSAPGLVRTHLGG